MPKISTPLNDTRIKALKPKAARYTVSDGGGLVLEVMTSGSKFWRYRYSLHGKQQPVVTIGEYPAVSLTAARERARRYAEIVAGGVSPVADARKDRGAVKSLDTIHEFAEYWIEQQMMGKSAEYLRTTRRALEKDIYPAIGGKSVSDVTPGDVLAICENQEAWGAENGPVYAKHPQAHLRVRDRTSARYEQSGEAIVARFVATQASRDRVLSPNEIGRVLRAVYASSIRRPLKLAIHLLVLTMVRKSELIEARWDEFDLDASIWRIPAERMKKDREHWVYLAPQAVAMLRELHATRTSHQYVFPSSRGADRPIAKSTLNQAVRALDMDVQHFVLHDFRRTASTHLHEMGQPSDAIEKALAHSIKGIKGVYNRAEYADERRRITALWADFVDAQIDEGRKVVIGKFGSAA
ncbi:tyrosine-type recombinase/integrase [Burkholderia pseudomallei]|uniref:tyrosine-type recombinase/integrase n=1 Tax=Burkholderia pseudomallei TaxID=28450 RepID=UPI00052B05C8|nr:phage integrase family protein [Burkholderia pseudomallei MSHR3965]KGS98240.1 phage integrase family protein [Burkholderia pseudomallei]KGW12100.1 phage integrase family protein [Burkholderia pseudomallei MSHR4000]